ncbi:MAG: aminopeptidase P family protein [Verrucomicrobia bacterium]|nr:aminopeptidase P family protein [Verrucomicrobiota bacterium]OQC62560.1 MAG: putative peptidase [Verrucomicrobia bacterium ADurb.Bin006]MDI9380629.1 Xaa-Pro peptidase family protein [Verrucomicrobiota bacterium]HOA59774.1 Xaa-Pro peptidase family protein [Verrucomicrobiota bacterium]HOF46696.1 Xaa-Pro peptidase family protein [Verrucomicrobiota bacterium]
MTSQVPRAELDDRMQRFRSRMEAICPDWELAAFLGRVNQYYLTGTMQDGLLLVPRDGDAVFWVRRSLERACAESLFPDMRPMRSFRDAAQGMKPARGRRTIHIEADLVPYGLVERFRKHFPCDELGSLEPVIGRVRSVKSPYELEIIERAGAIHRRAMEDKVPGLLREGMSEAEFACDLYRLMVSEGHEGTVRFAMFNVDIAVGQLGFGENSLYPTSFNGPGGCRGVGPAAPVLGSRDRRLRVGDLVFVDLGCSVEGYATDKTMIYAFGRPLPREASASHARCVEIQGRIAASLKPGAIPSTIYSTVMESLDPGFLEHFMGFGSRRAEFLGHGVGLQIDEPPVIAEGFDEPLIEGMVLAVEPKRGVPGVGMVGTENTYLVTAEGGRSLTGTCAGPILIDA